MHGPIMSSGLINPSMDSSASGAGDALALRLVRAPQDGSADLLVQLALAPSYVTYSASTLSDVAHFFRSEGSLELSSLQAQAAARTDKLRHMAQLQLRALSKRGNSAALDKPRMQLAMTLHAPKVAIPGE
jgi:Repeating coiled region of VPS13